MIFGEKVSYLTHPFLPIFDKNSEILILGSFPSVRSRIDCFYYSHPQNRFWKLITCLTNTESTPISVFEKKQILLKNRIALWDIVKSCDIKGSNDNSIINVTPADLSVILNNSNIKHILANGKEAHRLCVKYSVNALYLPSTSSANAAYSFERLVFEWKKFF
ncbi:MAG: DNA-deoxyinosine glycosylase [Holosporales bacterium]|jgi:hypoxanthine-DNA glycosylase|nr:DNA-deoxyinosine glycosylase [Holosporales bacterium]